MVRPLQGKISKMGYYQPCLLCDGEMAIYLVTKPKEYIYYLKCMKCKQTFKGKFIEIAPEELK